MESNLAFSETRSSIKVNLTKFLDVIFHIQPRGEVMRENKVTVLPAKCHMKRQSEIGKQINLQRNKKGNCLVSENSWQWNTIANLWHVYKHMKKSSGGVWVWVMMFDDF